MCKKLYKLILAIFVICLILSCFVVTGCTENKEQSPDVVTSTTDTEQPDEPVSSAPSYSFSDGVEISTEGYEAVNLGDAFTNWCFESSIGCYCLYTDWKIDENGEPNVIGDFLMYSESAAGPWIKLCVRPDCTHDDAGCNAYIGYDPIITCYDGAIFYAQGAGVYRVNLDGTGHESFYRMDIYSQSGMEYYFDSGYLYVAIQDLYHDTAKIYRIALEEGAEPEIMPEEIDVSGYQFMRPANGAVYIFRNMAEENTEETLEYYRYSFIDGSYKFIKSYDLQSSIYRFEYDYILYRDYSNEHSIETGIYKYDVTTDETERIFDITLDSKCIIRYDDKYTYINEESYDNPEKLFFYIYDSDYNLVNKVELPKAFVRDYTDGWASYFASTKDAVLFFTDRNEYMEGIEVNYRFPDYCLMKEDFYSDNLEFKKIEVFD